MEERYNDLPHIENAFTDAPRRYHSEARAERGSRFGRIFGGNEGEEPPVGGNGTVIYTPSTYEDVQMLIDHLKRGEQVIVDFSNVSQSSVYRILDFMSGAIYALNGTIQKITTNIFLFAPYGVRISSPAGGGRR